MALSKARQAEVAARRTRAIAMRTAGHGWQAIADALGYASRGAACADVSRALQASLDEMKATADVLREQELERLDLLQRKATEVLERRHLVVQSGKVVRAGANEDGDPEGEPLEDDGPTLAAVASLLRIAERRAKLLGLDAPVKADVTTTVRYDIGFAAPEDLM